MRSQPASGRVPAIVLAAVGGCVDAVGFIVLAGLFIAHQSGNSTGFAVALGQGDWAEVLRRGFVIPVFVVATTIGIVALDSPSAEHDPARRHRTLLVIEAGLLVAFAVGASLARRDGMLASSDAAYYLVGAVVASAMGLQNAIVRQVGSQTVHTTYITGMLTSVAAGLAQLVALRRTRAPDVAAARGRAVLAASVFGAYLAGAVVGSLGDRVVGLWTVALPITVIATLAAISDRPGRRATGRRATG